MSDDKNQNVTPFGDESSGGRYLIGGIFVVSVILFAMIGNQTTVGDDGGAGFRGGWWAEPAFAPGVALVLTIVASAIAFFLSRKEKIDWGNSLKAYGGIFLIAGCMVATVFLIKILGFALSMLVFVSVVALIGGFRGRMLIVISLVTTIVMVLVFRVGFGIWFPRPALFKWIDLPFWLQGIL